jgi:hypothetical protein
MSIVEQCAANVRAKTGLRMPYAEEVLDILAEFARLSQSPEMVERIVRQANFLPNPLAKEIVVDVIAALFREARVSGGWGKP